MRSLALGALAVPSWGFTRTRAGGRHYGRVFFDVRRPHALAFGDAARQLGAPTHAISGDVDDPCYDELNRRWQLASTPIAGMTDFRVLFLLQTMAEDVGMRPRLRIPHRPCGEPTTHEYMSDAGLMWSCAAAHWVMSHESRDAGGIQRAGDMSESNLGALDSKALVAWVIA